ncbi:hypothetical protein [Novosphingopyxis baekryungensis]|uniref:hypothetical protein n=1 Tax=Novosphingopyxis baekryungensis TaxID=279369 RepID=UPI0012EB5542|nr:hypothetical protein [Novosphingopyxis baekryungensis]
MPKRVALLSALVALGVAAPAAAQQKVADLGDILAASDQCISATGASGVSSKLMEQGGWKLGSVSAKGKAVDMPLRIYGKADNNALIMAQNEASSKDRVCIVLGRISSPQAYAPAAAAMTKKYGKPIKRNGNSVIWRFKNKIIQLDATGSPKKAAMRIAIIEASGGK